MECNHSRQLEGNSFTIKNHSKLTDQVQQLQQVQQQAHTGAELGFWGRGSSLAKAAGV